jgi:hypothetical protein
MFNDTLSAGDTATRSSALPPNQPQSTVFTRNLITESIFRFIAQNHIKNKRRSLGGVLPSLSLLPSRSLSVYRSAPIRSPATNFYRLIKGNFFYPNMPKLNFKAFISIGSSYPPNRISTRLHRCIAGHFLNQNPS